MAKKSLTLNNTIVVVVVSGIVSKIAWMGWMKQTMDRLTQMTTGSYDCSKHATTEEELQHHQYRDTHIYDTRIVWNRIMD